jgi:hypothetical protein
MLGQEVAEMQHSKKFVEKVRSAKMRQTPVIAGDEQISR